MRLPPGCVSLLRSEKWSVPLFLCPSLTSSLPRSITVSPHQRIGPPIWHSSKKIHIESVQPTDYSISSPHPENSLDYDTPSKLESVRDKKSAPAVPRVSPALLDQLPWSCPGCGAYTQLVDSNEAGYYSLTRKSVRAFTKGQRIRNGVESEGGDVFTHQVDPSRESLFVESLPQDHNTDVKEAPTPPTPVCNRCNSLLHHHSGTPIIHPSLQSLQDILSESPHKHNHIYHVLDAADFPLSLISHIHKHLALTPQRSHNRRSKTARYMSGRKAELSFIITRSDLLAPKKEQVDTLMPYLVQVLRDALGSTGKDVRLGNVRCVSAKRGWWTKTLKEDIFARGGGGWMIGKANVGKSNLFEVVFPKGYGEDMDIDTIREDALSTQEFPVDDDDDAPELLLLPPPQPFKPYPTMPIVSSLPGTTASPIRLPFGQSKGELIDLPGLPRNDFSPYVLPEHQKFLVMESRIAARQHVIKSGQSLLLGGLIRISLADLSEDSDLILLAAAFVPLKAHVGLTEKMVGVQKQDIESGIESIASPGVGEKIVSAGKFALEWDVTKARSGVLTDRKGIGLKADKLPYVVFSADVLIEGCGWVECTVQVRKKALEEANWEKEHSRGEGEMKMEHGPLERKTFQAGTPFVEVFSPEGKGIGIRRPMGAYMLGGEDAKPREKTSRPRRSMKGVKKRLKVEGRWKTNA